jgi:osmotically inducible protein OsmC
MSVNIIYTTSAIAVGGRDGNTGTTDGRFDVKLARPRELGGLGDGNNPEQLFASGYAACFLSSMQLLAAQGGPRSRRMPR